jgi:hypothetical protein
MQETDQKQAEPAPEQKPENKQIDRSYRWWEEDGKLVKLEQAFSFGCTDSEACNYAEITLDQLYYYSREVNPEFQARKERLKELPILKAKHTLVQALDSPEHAKWYLERKRKEEFVIRNELTGPEGKDLLAEQSFKLNSLIEDVKATSAPASPTDAKDQPTPG